MTNYKRTFVRTLTIALFGLLLIAPSLTAVAVESSEHKWEEYTQDRHGVRYFYDKETLTHPTPTTVNVWRQRIFPKAAQQQEIINLDDINCSAQKVRTLETIVKYRDGRVESFKKTTEWYSIYAGTAEEYFLINHCP